jgi:hypothetical protein
MNGSNNLQTGEGLRSILIAAALLFMVKSGFTQSVPTESLFLGQNPPGNTPEVFHLSVKQGFFAAERITVSYDGRDIYYSEIKLNGMKVYNS